MKTYVSKNNNIILKAYRRGNNFFVKLSDKDVEVTWKYSSADKANDYFKSAREKYGLVLSK